MEMDPTRMCALLVGLPDVTVLGVEDRGGEPLRVLVEMSEPRPLCPCCAGPAVVKDRRLVELVDLPVFGRPARLVWRKHRWMCSSSSCSTVPTSARGMRQIAANACHQSLTVARPRVTSP